MHCFVNGVRRELEAPVTVAALVEELGLAGKRIAVERNGEIVARSLHGDTRLDDDDRIEIVAAVGGG